MFDILISLKEYTLVISAVVSWDPGSPGAVSGVSGLDPVQILGLAFSSSDPKTILPAAGMYTVSGGKCSP